MSRAAQVQGTDVPALFYLAMAIGWPLGHHVLRMWSRSWLWLCTVIESKVQGKGLHCPSLWRAKDTAVLLVTWMVWPAVL